MALELKNPWTRPILSPRCECDHGSFGRCRGKGDARCPKCGLLCAACYSKAGLCFGCDAPTEALETTT